MSNFEARNAHLLLQGAKWCGPVFLAEVRALHAVVAAFNGHVDTQLFDEATKTLPRFSRGPAVVTSDDYPWFWDARMLVPGGCVAILVPHCTDFVMRDGTMTDRSTAGYFLGHATLNQVDEVARSIRLALPAPPMPAPMMEEQDLALV